MDLEVHYASEISQRKINTVWSHCRDRSWGAESRAFVSQGACLCKCIRAASTRGTTEGPVWERGSRNIHTQLRLAWNHHRQSLTSAWGIPWGGEAPGQAGAGGASLVSRLEQAACGTGCPSCRNTTSGPCPDTGYYCPFSQEHPSHSNNKSAPKCIYAGDGRDSTRFWRASRISHPERTAGSSVGEKSGLLDQDGQNHHCVCNPPAVSQLRF